MELVPQAPGMLSLSRSLKAREAQAGVVTDGRPGVSDGPIQLDPPTVKQAIAWEFALQSIRQQEVCGSG